MLIGLSLMIIIFLGFLSLMFGNDYLGSTENVGIDNTSLVNGSITTYFVETERIFEEIKKFCLPRVEMEYLSMGMTNSYKVALEEGANIVRLGTKIFGERHYAGSGEQG